METLDTKTIIFYGVVAVISISWFRSREKSTIPTITGSNGIVSSYIAGLHFMLHVMDTIHQGYYQYRDGVYRVPLLVRWEYVANGKQHIAEVASTPEHILSFHEAASEITQTAYTMSLEIKNNPYHVDTIRGSLTRNLGKCFPDVWDEIVHAFDDVLALNRNEWKMLHVLPNMMQLIARTSNRLFVGLPLCREQEYLDLTINNTVDIVTRGLLIGLLPQFLRPILGPVLSRRKRSLQHVLKFVRPMIDERLQLKREYGDDWSDRPGNLISWLLEIAEGEERTTPAIAGRILAVNMAAIHTSSMALTAALYDLTTYPEHILPMREEAERVVAEEGWSKASLGKMHKIDSFLRESQRHTGTWPLAMMRKVVAQDGFTFSDGTTIPCGAFVSVPGIATHYDPDNYEDPATFDGFRFSRLRERYASHATDGHSIFNRHMISTAPDHVVFGHGRHACPGRFFVAMELKAMLAHIVINYDVKAEIEGVRPPDQSFGLARFPNLQGRILIRKRA